MLASLKFVISSTLFAVTEECGIKQAAAAKEAERNAKFPTYVSPAASSSAPLPPPPSRRGAAPPPPSAQLPVVIALYDYESEVCPCSLTFFTWYRNADVAQDAADLNFPEGVTIELLEKVSEDWWKGYAAVRTFSFTLLTSLPGGIRGEKASFQARKLILSIHIQ